MVGKIRFCFFVLVAVSILISGCGNGPPEKLTPARISISSTRTDISSLVYLAKNKGYFQELALDVSLNEFESGKQAVRALLDNQADLSTASESAFVCNSFQNPGLRIVATISTFKNKFLIGRRDRGISTPKDLRGKRVGVTLKSGGEYFLGAFLALNGLTPTDIVPVDLKPSEIVENVTRGVIDAGLAWDPYAFEIQKSLAEAAVVWSVQDEQASYFLLIGRDQWLSLNPEIAQRLLRGLIKAEETMNSHQDNFPAFVAREFGYDDDYRTHIHRQREFKVGLPQELMRVMDEEARWRMESQIETAPDIPNYLEFIWFDGLKAVAPHAISMIYQD